MTKHDRLMKALSEIKETCVKNEDPEFGCGKKCPFLLGNDGDEYRPCEVMRYIDGVGLRWHESPCEWGEDDASQD